MKPRTLPGCLCFDSFVCSLHRVASPVQHSPWRCCRTCKKPLERGEVCYCAGNNVTAYAKEEADALDFDDHETPNLRDNWICRSQIENELTKKCANGGGISRSLAHSDDCPWNPDDLPEHLRGYGHRGADQDGFDGSQWVTPQQDYEGQMIEAVKVLLEAEEI